MESATASLEAEGLQTVLPLAKGSFVRIDSTKGSRIICRLKVLDRVFEMHLVFGQIYVADAVNIRPGFADAPKTSTLTIIELHLLSILTFLLKISRNGYIQGLLLVYISLLLFKISRYLSWQ